MITKLIISYCAELGVNSLTFKHRFDKDLSMLFACFFAGLNFELLSKDFISLVWVLSKLFFMFSMWIESVFKSKELSKNEE